MIVAAQQTEGRQDVLAEVARQVHEAEMLEAKADGLITIRCHPGMTSEDHPKATGLLSVVFPVVVDETLMVIDHGCKEPLQGEIVNGFFRVSDVYRRYGKKLAECFGISLDSE